MAALLLGFGDFYLLHQPYAMLEYWFSLLIPPTEGGTYPNYNY